MPMIEFLEYIEILDCIPASRLLQRCHTNESTSLQHTSILAQQKELYDEHEYTLQISINTSRRKKEFL